MKEIDKAQYEYALERIEELLPLVGEDTPASDRNAVELSLVSDVVVEYEKIHYPIDKPTVGELIKLSLEEMGLTQKELSARIGVSPSRVNDFVTGRAEPNLRQARRLCQELNIQPAAMLGL